MSLVGFDTAASGRTTLSPVPLWRPAPPSSPPSSTGSASASLVLTSRGEQAAERLTYDQPDARRGKAVGAYLAIARQERRQEIEQLLKVDLYV